MRSEFYFYMKNIFLLDLIRWHFFLLVPGSLMLFTSAFAILSKIAFDSNHRLFSPSTSIWKWLQQALVTMCVNGSSLRTQSASESSTCTETRSWPMYASLSQMGKEVLLVKLTSLVTNLSWLSVALFSIRCSTVTLKNLLNISISQTAI